MSASSRRGNSDNPTYAMPSEASTAPSVVSPNPPIFQIHKPDTFDFASLPGLTKVTGEPSRRLRRLLLKELTDNALDAADAAGRHGEVTIEKRGPDTYVITDEGLGLDGTPDELAALFAIHRPMVSTKYLRKPLRGALGNGLRVAVGCVVVSGGTIEVITHGKHVVLRPRRAGPTEIVSTSDVADSSGTTLIVTLDPTIPYDELDTMWAEDAISLSRFASGPAYDAGAERALDRPRRLRRDADADRAGRRDRAAGRRDVRRMQRRKAGKLAAPFGKNRSARSMSDADAAALLRSMQAAARVVKPDAFGLIGPDAFDPDDYSYASAKGTFAYGAHEPQAEIVHVVEAWVCATTRKGKSVEIDDLFANRSPIVGDQIDRGARYL